MYPFICHVTAVNLSLNVQPYNKDTILPIPSILFTVCYILSKILINDGVVLFSNISETCHQSGVISFSYAKLHQIEHEK